MRRPLVRLLVRPLIRLPARLAAASILLALGLAGCRIETHKNGDNDDVHIGTPFGSMHVKTDSAAALSGLGLTPYPGAAIVHKDGKDDGAADVNIGFGHFRLGVHALELQTADSQAKVLDFYRRDLGRYGAVLTCRGAETVGTPARTAQGLTCNAQNHEYTDSDLQLRSGSPGRQHVVSVKGKDGGTRIALVALEIPGDSGEHNDSDRE